MREPIRPRARGSLKDLLRLAEGGTAANAYALLPAHALLVEALVKEYGSLGAARDAAGLARGRPAETRATVVTSLRALADRGVRLVPKSLRRLGEDQLVRGCYELFGSMSAARDAAGLAAPTRAARPVAPRDEVLAALRQLAGPHRKLQGKDVRGTLAQDARHHFGTEAAAIDAAGLVRPVANQRWTRETVIEEIAARRARGQEVSWGALERDGRGDLTNAIRRHLGGKIPGVERARPGVASGTGRTRRPARPGPRRALAKVPRRNAVDARALIAALVARFVAQVVAVVGDSARLELQHAFAAKDPAPADADTRPAGTTRRSPARAPAASVSTLALDADRLHAVLTQVAVRHRLSPREAQVLAATAHGIPRSRLAEQFGTSENTVRSQVRGVLEKLKQDNLSEAMWWIRTQVERASPGSKRRHEGRFRPRS